MLPPVNTLTMERNPRFARLYQEMVVSRLNPDTSTKVIKQQRAALELQKSLYELRIGMARQTLIKKALEEVIAQSNLPRELIRSCQIVLAALHGDVTTAEAEILQDDLESFNINSHLISAAISAQLQSTATNLSAYLPSISHDPAIAIGHLPTLTSDLLLFLTNQSAAVSSARSRISDLATQVQDAHADTLETAIRVLEQTMHGSVARGIRARAEHLSAVAKGLDMKVRILAKNDPLFGNKELVEAVKAYDDQLARLSNDLDHQVHEVQKEALEYESAGQGMEQIADRYAHLLMKRSDFMAEVDRLKGMIREQS